jgi:hypothetical protein
MQCCSCCTTHSTGRTQVQNTPAGGGARACDVQPRSMLASGASSHISPSSANHQPLISPSHQPLISSDSHTMRERMEGGKGSASAQWRFSQHRPC